MLSVRGVVRLFFLMRALLILRPCQSHRFVSALSHCWVCWFPFPLAPLRGLPPTSLLSQSWPLIVLPFEASTTDPRLELWDTIPPQIMTCLFEYLGVRIGKELTFANAFLISAEQNEKCNYFRLWLGWLGRVFLPVEFPREREIASYITLPSPVLFFRK